MCVETLRYSSRIWKPRHSRERGRRGGPRHPWHCDALTGVKDMAKIKPPPRVLTAEDRRCVEELKHRLERVEALLELLEGGQQLVGLQAAEARRQFVAFKTDLRAEVKRLARLRRRGDLLGFELTDYAPGSAGSSGDFNTAAAPARTSGSASTRRPADQREGRTEHHGRRRRRAIVQEDGECGDRRRLQRLWCERTAFRVSQCSPVRQSCPAEP
jgi:hypothetical protein